MRCIIKLNPINTITQNLKQRKFLKGQSIRKETDLANGLSGTKGAFDHSHDFSVCTVNKKVFFKSRIIKNCNPDSYFLCMASSNLGLGWEFSWLGWTPRITFLMDEFVLGVKAKNSQSKASIHNKVTLLSKHRCRFYITLFQRSIFCQKKFKWKVRFSALYFLE